MNHLRRSEYPTLTVWDEYFRLWIQICVIQPRYHGISNYTAMDIRAAYERYCSGKQNDD